MTSIDKLLIQGIRAFSPQNRAVVEFYKPLTLIVGQNGAGKTTIIECLKYACTGQLPPDAASGKAWIHDTNLAGEREVKAQTRLRFRTAGGAQVVAIRVMQLTQGAQGKQTVKTLDSSLVTQDPETGAKVAQTRRCADIDLEVPELMGVSKAVLQNVIFCHQEESNWPLEDSATLKKRFDEIFAATRYTKALEDLRKQVKVLKETHKTSELELKTLGAVRENVQRIRQELAEAKQQLEAVTTSVNSKKTRLAELSQKRNMLQKEYEASRSHFAELQALDAANEQRQRALDASRNSLREHLLVSDAELEAMHKSFERRKGDMETELVDIEKALSDMQTQKAVLENRVRESQRQLGQIQSEQDQLQRMRSERDLLLRKICKEFKIAAGERLFGEGLLSDEAANAVVKEIESAGDKVKVKFGEMQAQASADEASAKATHDSLQRQVSELTAHIGAQRRHLQDVLAQIDQFTSLIEEDEDLARSVEVVEQQKQSQLLAWKTLRDTLLISSNADIAQAIKILESQQQEEESRHKSLNDELHRAAKLKLARAALDSQLEQKERADKLLKSAESDIFSRWGRKADNPKDLAADVELELASHRTDVQKLKFELDAEVKMLSSLEGQQTTLEQQLAKMSAERRSHAAQLNGKNIHDHSPLPERIRSISNEVERTTAEKATVQAEGVLFSKFAVDAEQENCCPLCKQSLPDVASFVKSLRRKLDELPSKLAEFDLNLKQQAEIRSSFESLLPSWNAIEKMDSKDIPDITQQLEDLKGRIADAKVRRDEAALKLERSQSTSADAQMLLQAVLRTVSLHEDCVRLASEVDAERARLGITSDTADMSQELTHQLSNSSAKSEEIAASLSKLRHMQLELASVEARLLKIANLNHDLVTQQHRLSEAKDTKSRLEKELAEMDSKKAQIAAQAEAAAEHLRSKQAASSERLAKYSSRIEDFKQEIMNVRSIMARNSAGADQEHEKRQTRLLEEIAAVETSLNRMQAEVDEKARRKEFLRNTLAQSELEKHNLEENMRLRVDQHELQEHLEAANLKRAQVPGDQQHLSAQIAAASREFDLASAQVNQLLGSKKNYEATIQQKRRDLELEKHKNIEDEHRQMVIKIRTTEAAIKDLDAYYKALDKALMKYHTSKMEEINKIIKELWESTYKGGDIDSIQIKAEVEDDDPLKQKRRQYKYRVVMVKGPTELDMRGRCSAGQKVLASLIIRLALAETFCVNCGILALDEPTTNLDRDNVDSLALALSSLIEARKGGNFQLIVITHDEEFVRHLGQGQHTDHYWRVTKDDQGHSSVEKIPVGDLS